MYLKTLPSEPRQSGRGVPSQEQITKPVFIGGTGRCGTSLLKRIVGRHSQVFALRSEAHFLVDPDGLIDLADALSVRYHAAGSEKALRRFGDLMRNMRTRSVGCRVVRRLSRWFGRDLFDLVWPGEYAAYGNGREFGLDHYDRTVADFMQQIEACRFRGVWAGSRSYQFRPVVRQARRFERADILEKCREFAHRLYAHRLAEQHKTRWVEDTPKNMLMALQLVEMFPDMKLVHVFRDPRDVIASYVTRRWAPAEHGKAVLVIADQITAWLGIRDRLCGSNVFPLRFEDLIAAPQETLRRLCKFLELPFEAPLLNVDLSQHNIGRYRQQLSPEVTALAETALATWMEENGYSSAQKAPTAVPHEI